MSTRPTRLAIFTLSATLTCTFFLNLCDLLFHCGCRSLWSGAAAHCNIHTPGVRHCPWCSSVPAQAATILTILAAQFAITFWPGSHTWRQRLLLALAVFPISAALIGVASGILSGYWR